MFDIIVPGRFVEAKDPVRASMEVEGWWVLSAMKNGRVLRTREFKERRTNPFQNMVLDQALDWFGNTPGQHMYWALSVGTSSTAPSAGQTQLLARVGTGIVTDRTDTKIPGVAPDWFHAYRITWLSNIGEFGNNNLTEIGVGPESGANSMFSRALILDSGGSPAAFPIAADEQLQATYELRLYPPLADVTGTVNIGGMRDFTVRAIGVHSVNNGSGAGWFLPGYNAVGPTLYGNAWYSGALSSINSYDPPGYIAGGLGTFTDYTYSAGSHKRKSRISYSSSQMNYNNMRTHKVLWNCASFQIQYDPPIEKTALQTMFLEYELSWARR